MAENLVRRRGAPRLAVQRETLSGQAELVPDLSRSGSWLLFANGVPQSQVDLEDPGYLEFEYVRRIGHVIDLAFGEGEPLRALHLGGGALTLPRYVAHTRPGSSQLVAEIDAPLTELVREHLPLPRVPKAGRIRVRADDARAVLESVPAASYDLVVSDVFAGARTPFHLTTAECAMAAARALRPGGVYVANVADGPPQKEIRSAVATIRSVWKGLANICMIAEPGVIRGRRLGNFVLVASARPLPLGGLRRRAAGDPFPARVVYGAELARFTGTAPVITDTAEPGANGTQPTTS
ncbi:MAG: fused MFS/spermidine synthase [Nocardiopsaceae bacterium]|nr:fused MFS/spermidine synthase [Nocardiopsaceae bacterium]